MRTCRGATTRMRRERRVVSAWGKGLSQGFETVRCARGRSDSTGGSGEGAPRERRFGNRSGSRGGFLGSRHVPSRWTTSTTACLSPSYSVLSNGLRIPGTSGSTPLPTHVERPRPVTSSRCARGPQGCATAHRVRKRPEPDSGGPPVWAAPREVSSAGGLSPRRVSTPEFPGWVNASRGARSSASRGPGRAEFSPGRQPEEFSLSPKTKPLPRPPSAPSRRRARGRAGRLGDRIPHPCRPGVPTGSPPADPDPASLAPRRALDAAPP